MQKSHFHEVLIFAHLGLHFGDHFGSKSGTKSPMWLSFGAPWCKMGVPNVAMFFGRSPGQPGGSAKRVSSPLRLQSQSQSPIPRLALEGIGLGIGIGIPRLALELRIELEN